MSRAQTYDRFSLLILALGVCLLIFAVLVSPAASQLIEASPAAEEASPGTFMPAYDDDDRLLLPEDYRRWVFVGSSLGLSYSEGGGGMEMFHETLMEPTAYEHFTRTGEFRDGTMLALLLHGVGENVLPQRSGRFAAEIHGVEMAVKDSRHSERGWDYYGFGGMDGIRDRATAIGGDSCYDCHSTEAAHDNVFMQFYPLLAEAAPTGTAFRTTSGRTMELAAVESAPIESGTTESASTGSPDSPEVALSGLDPVLLIDGQSELGKPEIVMEHDGYVWQFVSEPTRARFEADPVRFSFQNESCLVVPGATIESHLFTVHEGKLYGFASEACVTDFLAEPERYLEVPAAEGP